MGKWKVAAVIAFFVMLTNCLLSLGPLEEVGPVTLMMLGVTHLVLRAPYLSLQLWEVPLMASSLGFSAFGAWSFQPEEPGFRVFFAAFVTLALSYGFACTASAPDTRWRREVLEPTRHFSRFSLPFLDFGLVFAPFLFPLLAVRYLLGSK